MEEHDERTFLCGYQNSRGYGSTSCLQTCKKRYRTVVRHKVEPSDTLRGIVLKYNTSVSSFAVPHPFLAVSEVVQNSSDPLNILTCDHFNTSALSS